MILQIYFNASHISEPEAQSRAGGYFFIGPKPNTPIQEIPPENGPGHVECSIMRNVKASATEAELGGLFENCQKATFVLTALVEMGYQQPTKLVAMDNTAANRIVNRTAKQKISRAIDMIF